MSNDLFGNLGFGGGKSGGFPGFPGGFGAGKDGGNGRGGSGGAGGNGNRPLPKIKFKKPGPLGIAIGVIVALVVVLLVASAVWTEVLWYRQTGYLRVLLTQWIAAGGMFIVAFLIAWAILAVNLHVAYRNRPEMGTIASSIRSYRSTITRHHRGIFLGIPALIALFLATGMAASWRQVLVAITGGSFGKKDPQFGFDISFFVFRLPLIDMAVTFLLTLLGVSLVACLICYYLLGAMTVTPKAKATRGARIHMGVLLAISSVMVGITYVIDRWTMVYGQNSPTDGAMYTDVHAIIPARTILAVIALIVAALFVFAAFRGGWYLPAAGIAVTVVSALVIGAGYPFIIQQFRVRPNERELESQYIDRNIKATLDAFGMKDLDLISYDQVTNETSANQLRQDADSTQQIRLLDPEIISPAVRQMKQSRPYYSFPDQFAVDRYNFPDKDGKMEKRDTVIAVRDINLNGLAQSQRNWVNDHTVYTHGFGVVAAYGNQVTSEGLPSYWESSLSDKESGDIGDYEKRIYFSQASPEYSIVGAPKGADPKELDYQDAKNNKQVYTTFDGDGGPQVGNFLNKVLYALKFRSTDLFFSDQINSESQILYDRDPATRVAKVAPYLTLDSRAYPAIVNMDGKKGEKKRLVWIVDAYTTTDSYPYSQHINLTDATADTATARTAQFAVQNNVNYMRNSVKAVVDAYDGSVQLYQWDKEDPILKAWQKIYPGQIKPLSEISGDLMSHLRYPEDYFKAQRSLLANYHVTNPSEFYTGGDQWKLSEDPTATSRELEGSGKLQPPYYLTMKMPTGKNTDQGSAEFSLTSVFIPGGEGRRAAMAGFLAVDSETGNEKGKVREGYGKMRLLALPSDTTVPGPGQVQNTFNSDPEVNRELNLQDQQGSRVIRGNLLTLPVGGGLLYVQPVYVQSTGTTQYPQLRSVLVGFGDKVGFAPTLKEALDQVFGGDSGAVTASNDGNKKAPAAKGKAGEATAKAPSAQEKLNTALQDAKKAMAEADSAMKAGDWTKYGEAQKSLNDAISRAVSAQDEGAKTAK
ncbi:UPF0182 family protein [Varibaculum cambriense]|uniref:UPF0182 family membrane protein n=1 Tax=Varibaculum cambriense TaxID=184870 RepID=UPI00241DAACF|nr:UPF0182 family protein [Varibaculum cambriense]